MSREAHCRAHLLVFCPLPPKPNGIADYFAEQLPYLATRYQCTVVIEDTHTSPVNVPKNVLVVRLQEYLSRRQHYANAIHLYHVGNNPDTRYLLPILLTTPGIVVIHDLNLHHLIESQTTSNNRHLSYRDVVFQQYGRLGAIAGENITDTELKNLLTTIDLPFNGSVIDSAHSLIAHSIFTRLKIDAYQPGKTKTIAHHLTPNVPRCSQDLALGSKRNLGLPLDRIVIASFGFIARAKQISIVLATLARLKSKGVEFVYILAGEEKATEYDVSAEIRKYDLINDVIVTGYLDETLFFEYMTASDLIINLRHPTGGETSGTFVRAMGIGKCCIIVDIGPFSEVPSQCAVKIPWSEHFSYELESRLQHLITDRPGLEEIGSRARAWILETHSIDDTIEAYSEVIDQCPAPGQALLSQPWPGNTPLRYLPPTRIELWERENCDRLPLTPNTGSVWWRESLIHVAETGSKLIVIAEDRSPNFILRSLYNYLEEQLTFISIEEFVSMKHAQEFSEADSILAILPCDIFIFDPVEIFVRINWLSRLGCNVAISVLWDTQVEGDVALSTSAFCEYLRAAGLIVDQVLDGLSDVSFSSPTNAEAIPEYCFRSRVASRMSDRYPQPYYRGYYSEAKLIRSHNLGDLINQPDIDTTISGTVNDNS